MWLTKKGNCKLTSKRNDKGMTLIEIMIVLAIVGGVMAMLGQKIMSNFNKAKQRQTRAQLSELGKALDLYNSDCNDYPPTDAGLRGLLNQEGTGCESWGPEAYIKPSLMKDPFGNEIQYENSGGNYLLKSLGKDKKEGGSGYDSDITNEEEAAKE
ncbi:MAG: type II secretion system major pseudopilin GspG [Pseudomonadota bacterium]|nr:type II secretion system major pseudopilin GspG [Pseudomonadota bacterium]